MRIHAISILMLAAILAFPAMARDKKKAETKPKSEPPASAEVLDFPLHYNLDKDGKLVEGTFVDAKGWKATDFTGKGKVRIEKNVAYLEQGNDMTGITWTGPVVRMNYEITLDAMRVEGTDFFCGLTFPVGPDPCSFIVGGWGGTCVGISSLDYNDAYNNETARFISFDLNRWYAIRVRVTPGKIQAWIDDKQVVDVDTEGRKIGIRLEVEKSVPLGVATWRTTGAIRDIQVRAFTGDK